MGRRIGWVDASGGVSGDMLLGACLNAGAPQETVQAALDSLGLAEGVLLELGRTRRSGLAAARARFEAGPSSGHRTFSDIVALLAPLEPRLRDRATAVFHALADAEARVHGVAVEQVHFHEVGALDSIADIVGGVVALDALGLDRLVCSTISLGGGRVRTEHGVIPVPGPAVLQLLSARGSPGRGGPIDLELATPTGVALMTVLADEFSSMPILRPERIGVGAGKHDPQGHTNVTRLVIGTDGAGEPDPDSDHAVVIEANVDDLDPRLWPTVLSRLLGTGAYDAWLTPILMKKGRPAHTLSVAASPDRVADVEELVLTHTSTIGLRRHAVTRTVLPREWVTVSVSGAPVRVKIARFHGRIVNVAPENDDVERAAVEHDVPAKTVLAAALTAAQQRLGSSGPELNGPVESLRLDAEPES